jgi:hypothetical protein
VEKENICAFIAKKREIFFVQLSLDIKREEMGRLKERAQQACDSTVQHERAHQWHT